MGKIKINKEKCKGCGLCVIYCPNKLVRISEELNKKGLYTVKFEDHGKKCTGCSVCALMCPDFAIEVYR